MTKTYAEVLAAANEASKAFRKAQLAYRAREIGDTEFLAAKAAFDVSEVVFSKARGEVASQAE